MRSFVLLSSVFCLLVATAFAPLVAAAPLPQAAIEPCCPRMLCHIASTPSDSSIAGDPAAAPLSSEQSTIEDLLEGLILILSSMRQLAAAAAAPATQVSLNATSMLSPAAPTSTAVVDLASIATFTSESPAPTSA